MANMFIIIHIKLFFFELTRSKRSAAIGCPEVEEKTNDPISATPLFFFAVAAAAEKSKAIDSGAPNIVTRAFSRIPAHEGMCYHFVNFI